MPTYTPTPSHAVVLGAGSVLSILGPTGVTPAGTPAPIGELSDGKLTGFKLSTTTSTNFDSGNIEKNLGTIFSYGTLTATYNNVVNNVGQLALIAAMKTGVAYDFELQLLPEALWGQTTTGNLYTMSALVTEAGGFDFSQTKVSSCSLTLTLNDLVITPGA